ncbi:MAG: gamma-glutamylcyclotransferase family protein [Pseudomonadota bacterium]
MSNSAAPPRQPLDAGAPSGLPCGDPSSDRVGASRHLVFVYGTLKRGYPNHVPDRDGERFIGNARTLHAYPLVSTGRWHIVVLVDEAGRGERVEGELFELDEAALARWDDLESVHLPDGYVRLAIPVESLDPLPVEDRGDPPQSGSALAAWAYLKPRARLGDVHKEFGARYPHDPDYVPRARRTP